LFLGVIRVKVWSFRFKYAKRPTLATEYVIGAPALTVQFKTDSTVVQKIPAAVFERLVDQDARKCFGFGHDWKREYISGRQNKCSAAGQ